MAGRRQSTLCGLNTKDGQPDIDISQGTLPRLGLLVHFLDVGGIQPPEAAGVESVLVGLRKDIADDDQLLMAVHAVFDGLLTTFNKGLHVQ